MTATRLELRLLAHNSRFEASSDENFELRDSSIAGTEVFFGDGGDGDGIRSISWNSHSFSQGSVMVV